MVDVDGGDLAIWLRGFVLCRRIVADREYRLIIPARFANSSH
jgi:hypothetical protein